METETAVILMAKAPVPGTVKTRLCPPLIPGSATSLYTCMLEDVAAEMGDRLQGVRRYLFFTPQEQETRFLSAPFRRFERVPQQGKDLGERMDRAIRTALTRGARRAVVIGADCPFLSAVRVRAAFRELSGPTDLVFGPSEDGGFYLIGAPFPVPFLFRGVAWGTGSALAEVVSRCRRTGLSYALLPMELDVDRPEDLEALRRRAIRRSMPRCPRTRRWLERFISAGTAPDAAETESVSSRGRDRQPRM